MKLLAVEFNTDGTPHQAWVAEEVAGRPGLRSVMYDLGWSKSSGRLLAEKSGGGRPAVTGERPWWAAPGVEVARIDRTTGRESGTAEKGRLLALPAGWPADAIFKACGDPEQMVWCDECADWLDGERDRPCPHVRVGLLRGAGNAIVPRAGAAFVRAFMEATGRA